MRRSIISLVSIAIALAGCRESRHFTSPEVAQGAPKFPGAGTFQAAPDAAAVDMSATAAARRTAPPTYARIDDSNAWVEETFRIQKQPARVLVVGAKPPAKVELTDLDLNRWPGGQVAFTEHPVAASFRTIQEVDAAHGGDLVAVMPGRYQGFAVGDGDTGDGRYLEIRALGQPGEVVIDRPNAIDRNWMILIQRAHHVVLEGFAIAGDNDDAGSNPHGPNAGIFLDGDFGRSGKLTHHVAVSRVFSHHHRMWGLHSTDTRDVLIQDSLFAYSAHEHGAYVSDGSDDYVIRRNVFFHNKASGLQVNLDPLASLEETMKHPAMRAHRPLESSRAWAEGALAFASERFGERNFPDGRGENFLIEENVMNQNGPRGGAAINLAALRHSVIQNNLAYDNFASGIVLWDNANPFDAAQVANPPADATTPLLFGCVENVVRGNTILGKAKGRPALMIGNGSSGTRAVDNVLVNASSPSIEIWPTGIFKTFAESNVAGDVGFEQRAETFTKLATRLPDGPKIGAVELGADFVKPGDTSWVRIENGWWRLDPARPDFRPKKGAKLLAGRGKKSDLPARDLTGQKRATADIGALAE